MNFQECQNICLGNIVWTTVQLLFDIKLNITTLEHTHDNLTKHSHDPRLLLDNKLKNNTDWEKKQILWFSVVA